MTKDRPYPSRAQGDSRAATIHAAYTDAMRWGLIPIPARRLTKHPAVAWADRQERMPTPDEVEAWIRTYGSENIGFLTGPGSGVIVIDFDTRDALASAMVRGMPDTPRVRTSRGAHVYFRHPGYKVPTKASIAPGIDVRGNGGFVMAPPSLHCDTKARPARETGFVYAWERTPDDVPFADAPAWMLEMLSATMRADAMRDEAQRDEAPEPSLPVSERPIRKPERTPSHLARKRMEAAARAAMDDEESRVSAATEGTRDHSIFTAAANMGEFIPGGWISEREVRARLEAAARLTGQPPDEVRRAINSGLKRGKLSPRPVPRDRDGFVRRMGPPPPSDIDAPPPTHTGARDSAAPREGTHTQGNASHG